MSLLQSVQLMAVFLVLQSCVYQRADMKTDMDVSSPAFTAANAPRVLFDAGHGNFHDIKTTYAPFAKLLENDGIRMSPLQRSLTEEALQNADLLIIANATASDTESAFSPSEISALAAWIQQGGSLLLIADHEPFGSAASQLAGAFGVGMGNAWTVDPQRLNEDMGRNTWLEYSRENGGLGEHPILQTGNPGSAVQRVLTFTGQSLSFDSTWTSILQLSDSARNYYQRSDASVASQDSSTYFSVPGESQLIAGSYGKGRIVVAGEAAMFTAQEVRIFLKTMRAGFNYKGYDNKKLVLNIVHWLLFEIN